MKKNTGLSIGVDLGGTNVRAGLVSGEGEGEKVVALAARPIRSEGSRKDVFSDLCSVIDEVIGKTKVRGIGIGVPSLVNQKTGTIFDTTNIPAWQDVPLREWLEKRYKVPARIDNDANCFALGERYFGQGKKCENFVALVSGTGVGAGIISRGRLHSGQSCAAGEFGMIPYRDGILERYASGQFFKSLGLDGAELAQRAKAGDRDALQVFNEFGEHFAQVIKTVLFSLAPELIILGGAVSSSYKYFSDSVAKSLEDFAFPSVARGCKIKVSRLKHVAVLGAASLVTDQTV